MLKTDSAVNAEIPIQLCFHGILAIFPGGRNLVRAIIFDRGGTLADTMPHHQLVWHALFADMDTTVDRDNFYQRAVGTAAPSGNVGLVRNGLDPRNRFQGVVGAAGFTDPLRNSLFNWLPI